MRIENAQLIGIAGVARSGKDTLFECIRSWMDGFDVECKRIALADKLKEKMAHSVSELGIDINTQDTTTKQLIRPLLVAYGGIARKISGGTFWTSLIEDEINDCIQNNVLPIITDIRYAEYEGDEVAWLKKMGGILIHVERFDANGHLILPPNDDEKRNDPLLRGAADLCIQWPTLGDRMDLIKEYAFEEFNKDF